MPNKATHGWKNLREKAAEGIYDLVDPLDYLILEILPDEGELVMGYYPYAKSVDQIIKERFDGLSPGSMSGALRRLSVVGLVVRARTQSRQSQYGYQRTPKGKELYEEWAKSKAPDSVRGEGGQK